MAYPRRWFPVPKWYEAFVEHTRRTEPSRGQYPVPTGRERIEWALRLAYPDPREKKDDGTPR